MLRLETLGGLSLIDAAGHPVALPRRRLALLALLAVAGERGMTRDKVVAILWPESSPARARHALEQLLYAMRRHAADPMVIGVDPLQLDGSVVQTDVAEFSRHLTAGDSAAAARCYRGPFLDGFYLSSAPEFEQWAGRVRDHLEAEHAKVLRTLAVEAGALGHHTAEIDLRRQLLLADPFAGRAASDLVRALAASGDFAAAFRAAREYDARMKEEMPGVPTTDLQALVEGLRPRRAGATEPGREGAHGGGRYAIEQEIGRGAVAVVYRARDRRVDRLVALKLLRPELATAIDARRFRREIAVLSRLYHPYILQLYDSGVLESEGGGPAGLYYVMPYVAGPSLRQRLEREPQLPIDVSVRIACHVAEALEYAHAKGVLHRDIRPENILLEGSHALLTDFGIAGVVELTGAERLSASGIVLGVPGYISPEQERGESALDGRSDLYSLGCVLYELLGGMPPFTGATRAAIVARQLNGVVPPLRTVRPDLPDSLERVVARALAPRPEQRFGSAGELLDALRGV